MRITLFAACFFAAVTGFAQTKQNLTVDRVTVFLTGAEIEGRSKIALPAGESEVIFTNVSGSMRPGSISVGADNGVLIQSATPKNDYLVSTVVSPKAQSIKDSVEWFTAKIVELNNKKTTVDEQLSILRDNKKVAGANSGLSVAALQQLLDLVNSKMTGLLNEDAALAKQIEKANKRIELLNLQYEEEIGRAYQPGGQLAVKFYAKAATTANIIVSYVTDAASWTPTYDLRVANLNGGVTLVYKAELTQNTGVAWNNVQLSLSTGNPHEGAEAPVLSPWYLSFLEPRPIVPTYRAKLPAAAALQNTSTKYEIAGARASFTPPTIADYVTVDNSGIATRFDIDLKYTIPSDGQAHLVNVKDYELPATYRYYAVPKLEEDVFLQARVTNWEELNLIPAATNIFYEGVYVGQGFLDTRGAADTLNFSLGRDKRILVKRENDKNYRAQKNIGSNVRRSFAYTIEVRNTKKEAIDLTLFEQFPISNDKDISVEDKEAPDARIDEATGNAEWQLKLKPSESKTLKIRYTIKYPKGKIVSGI